MYKYEAGPWNTGNCFSLSTILLRLYESKKLQFRGWGGERRKGLKGKGKRGEGVGVGPSSRPITEVKLGRAGLVLTWVTGWEYLVRWAFFHFYLGVLDPINFIFDTFGPLGGLLVVKKNTWSELDSRAKESFQGCPRAKIHLNSLEMPKLKLYSSHFWIRFRLSNR